MPGFTLSSEADAPVEEVWKLLFDPSRLPEWWTDPDLPVPLLRADPAGGRVTWSCQASAVEFSWQLAEHGDATRITVRVDMPAALAPLLAQERAVVAASLTSLAAVVEADLRADS
jgi:uncharacterized protein YndB with AHSA1/START domain